MLVQELEWTKKLCGGDTDVSYLANHHLGYFSVLDRLTGWGYNVRDTETGYHDLEGTFWLASGMFDIRDYPDMTIEEAVAHVKRNANTCAGVGAIKREAKE